jgi:plasmid stabilization system protein ParE
MDYEIELSRRAARDIDAIFSRIHADAPLNAKRWRSGLNQKLELLTHSAHRFGLAPENNDSRREVRQLMFGQYRILYTVDGVTAYVMTIRHGARQFLTGRQIDRL